MKSLVKLLRNIAFVAIIGFITCKGPVDPGNGGKDTTGSINGKAYFVNGNNHAGITITLEKTDGLRSVAAIAATRNIASGARSIDIARSAMTNTQTIADGSYSFTGVAPGTYTIYASSSNSSERAVAINNVTLEAGKSITASDLKRLFYLYLNILLQTKVERYYYQF